MDDVLAALHDARKRDGRPKAIVLRTLPGRGVATLEHPRESAFRPRRASRGAVFERELETSDA